MDYKNLYSLIRKFDGTLADCRTLFLDTTIAYHAALRYFGPGEGHTDFTTPQIRMVDEFAPEPFPFEPFAQRICPPLGINLSLIGGYAMGIAYEFWDQQLRKHIASLASVEETEIAHDVFGEMRLVRHAFVHQRGSLKDLLKKFPQPRFCEADGAGVAWINLAHFNRARSLSFEALDEIGIARFDIPIATEARRGTL